MALPRCVPSVLRHLLGSSDAAASRETSLSRPQYPERLCRCGLGSIASIQRCNPRPPRYKELLTGGKVQNFRRIVLCMAVNILQQFTGSNMINYYAPVVYQQTMRLSRTLSFILGRYTSLTYLVGSIIPLWVSFIPQRLQSDFFSTVYMP